MKKGGDRSGRSRIGGSRLSARGQGLAEYLAIVVVVCLLVLVSVRYFGRSVSCQYSNASSKIGSKNYQGPLDADGCPIGPEESQDDAVLPHRPSNKPQSNPGGGSGDSGGGNNPPPPSTIAPISSIKPATSVATTSAPPTTTAPVTSVQATSAPTSSVLVLPKPTSLPTTSVQATTMPTTIPATSLPPTSVPSSTVQTTISTTSVSSTSISSVSSTTTTSTSTSTFTGPCYFNCATSACGWSGSSCSWNLCLTGGISMSPVYQTVPSAYDGIGNSSASCSSITNAAECNAKILPNISWVIPELGPNPAAGGSWIDSIIKYEYNACLNVRAGKTPQYSAPASTTTATTSTATTIATTISSLSTSVPPTTSISTTSSVATTVSTTSTSLSTTSTITPATTTSSLTVPCWSASVASANCAWNGSYCYNYSMSFGAKTCQNTCPYTGVPGTIFNNYCGQFTNQAACQAARVPYCVSQQLSPAYCASAGCE